MVLRSRCAYSLRVLHRRYGDELRRIAHQKRKGWCLRFVVRLTPQSALSSSLPGLTRWSIPSGGALWIAGSSPAMTKEKTDEKRKDMERRQTPDPTCRAAGTAAPSAEGARLSASHRGSALGSIASPRCNFRPCFRGPGLAPILSHPPAEGRSGAVFAGVTRLHLSQSSEHLATRSVVPGD